ncbi:MAG TPA: phytanoyl-CoA dioxygenase family protein [Candidatus Limnocylindrales bacterium]|nr:phytanoyl-CoA dioxygenase family protein [Candidatus Limnocylindrales bacterium]
MKIAALQDSTGASPETLRRRAAADGYLFLRRAIPQDRLMRLRRRVAGACVARGWLRRGRTDPSLRLGAYDDPRFIAFLQEIMGTKAYGGLQASPSIRTTLQTILDDDPVPNVGDLCRLVSPGAVDLTTPPHQDAAYVRSSERMWTAWMPLTRCPLPLGPLAVLPGSHRNGLCEHASDGVTVDDDAEWATGDLEPGDVIFFSSTTIHRALPNLTADRLRISVDYRYRPRSELA